MFQVVWCGILQPVYHTINTSPTCWIKTHHTTASIITLHRPNNFNSQDFNNCQLLTHIYITYKILTKIIILIAMELW